MRHALELINLVGNYFAIGVFWFTHWLYRAVVVSLTGGLVGLLVTPIVKVLFFSNSSWAQSLWTGFITGCQYAGIWASGIALLWVIIDRRRIRSTSGKLLATEPRSKENKGS